MGFENYLESVDGIGGSNVAMPTGEPYYYLNINNIYPSTNLFTAGNASALSFYTNIYNFPKIAVTIDTNLTVTSDTNIFSIPIYEEGNETPAYYWVLKYKTNKGIGSRVYTDKYGTSTASLPNNSEYGTTFQGARYWQIMPVAYYSNDKYIVFAIYLQNTNNVNGFNPDVGSSYITGLRLQNFYNRNLYLKYVEKSEQFGEPSTEGGYTGGTFDDSSDVISIPTAPTLGVTSAGFINVYSPSANELAQFGSELFPDLSFTPVSQGGTPSSVTDALVAMAQVLVDFGNQIPALIDMYINANLIQYVIDCHLIPVAPTTTGTSPLKVGFKTFSQTPAKVTSDYIDFDCGTLNVGEYYANFIDYSPYTSAKLYLPFVGFMDIAPEYWQSGTLQVIYRFNVIDGSFVAYVKSTSSKSKLSDTVIAQFGGNACVHIPITGLNYASMVSGIVSAVSPLLPSSKANVGTVDKLVNSANTIASAKPTMQQSNGYNATTSFLTVRVPYLLIERSVSNFSRKYDSENGIPSNITLDFSTLSGFTKATMLHLDGIAGATEDDLDEIASLLAEGVIL